MTFISEKIADFVEQLSFKDLSPATIEISKKSILDALGNALIGFNTPWASATLNFVMEEGGREEATVINYSIKIPTPNAALVNGTMMHSSDFDDVSSHGGHPGAVIVPTALSVSEKVGGDGRDFILSIVKGYEIMDRLIRAVDPLPERDHYSRGFHPTATCGTFASTVVAGNLLKLTVEQQCSALGVAGSYAAGLMECYNDGSMTKCFHTGKAAHDGIVSAILAQKGLTGSKSIFEGEYGFLRAYSDATEPEKLTQGLGSKPFEIQNTTFKLHAGCLYTHSALNGILDLMNENSLGIYDIEKVVVGLGKVYYKICADPLSRKYAPINVLDAQVSLPYLAALVMVLGRPITPNDFDEKKIRNPELLRMARKVKPVIDPRLDQKEWYDKRPANVEITTVDGQKHLKTVPFPKGDPRDPLTLAQLEEKFTALASPVLGHEKTSEILRIVNKLEKTKDIKELGDVLAHPKHYV